MALRPVGNLPQSGDSCPVDIGIAIHAYAFQYGAFYGTTQRIPPRGSATSPAYLGMTWIWACSTVCPAASPSFTPMLNPCGRCRCSMSDLTSDTNSQTVA